MTVSVVRSKPDMEDLEEAWTRLANARRNPLYSYDWHSSCYETLHGNDELHVVVSRSAAGEITGIAPLVATQRGRVKWLEFIGASSLFEPCDILAADAASRQSILSKLAQSPMPVLLRRVESPSDAESSGLDKRLQSGIWLERSCAGAPELDLGVEWSTFLDNLSGKRRSDFRRATRRANTRGELKFIAEDPNADGVAHLLNLAKDIEDKSWKGRHGSSLAKNKELAAFLEKYCTQAATSGILRVFFLHVGDTPVATAVCLETFDALWFLKIGYDENYSKCSPGILLLMHIIEYACNSNIGRIEHLGSPAAWLTPWTSSIRSHSTYIHYPLNITGAALLARDSARSIGARMFSSRRES